MIMYFITGGATGQECVKRLLAVTTSQVRAVVRDPQKYEGQMPADARLQVCGIRKTETRQFHVWLAFITYFTLKWHLRK